MIVPASPRENVAPAGGLPPPPLMAELTRIVTFIEDSGQWPPVEAAVVCLASGRGYDLPGAAFGAGRDLMSWGETPDADGRVLCLLLDDGEQRMGRLVMAFAEPVTPARELCGAVAAFASAVVHNAIMRAVTDIRDFEVLEAQSEAITMLGFAEECRDKDTRLHVVRVAHYCRCLAEALGLPEAEVDTIFRASPMHDIGKIGIPDHVLLNPGRLSVDEMRVMHQHTVICERILSLDSPLATTARTIAASHHERWDGSGYPLGLKGEDIPLFGRICAVADVFDALCSARPYKPAWPIDEVVAYISDQAGSQFDPRVVEAFLGTIDTILKFKEIYGEELITRSPPEYLVPFDVDDDQYMSWSRAYETGHSTIDTHHKYLFELGNELHRSLRQGGGPRAIARAMRALMQYASVHFHEEERLMRQAGYAGLDAHMVAHRGFIRHMRDQWERFRKSPLTTGRDLDQYLRDWLIDHICRSDQQALGGMVP